MMVAGGTPICLVEVYTINYLGRYYEVVKYYHT